MARLVPVCSRRDAIIWLMEAVVGEPLALDTTAAADFSTAGTAALSRGDDSSRACWKLRTPGPSGFRGKAMAAPRSAPATHAVTARILTHYVRSLCATLGLTAPSVRW